MNYILNTTKDSIDRNLDNIVGFYYSVDRVEEKRVKFYDKIIEQIVKYKDKYVDVGNGVIRVVYLF